MTNNYELYQETDVTFDWGFKTGCFAYELPSDLVPEQKKKLKKDPLIEFFCVPVWSTTQKTFKQLLKQSKSVRFF